MSLCKTCKKRGICCEKFTLRDKIPWHFTSIENKKTIIKHLKKTKLEFFKPIHKGKRYWVFTCAKLEKGLC